MADFVTWLEAKALVGQKTYLCWTAAPQKFHFKVETWKSRAQPCENTPQSSSRTPQKKVLQWKDSQFANFILTLFSGKTSVPSTNYILNVLTDVWEWAGVERWSQGLVAGSSAKKIYIFKRCRPGLFTQHNQAVLKVGAPGTYPEVKQGNSTKKSQKHNRGFKPKIPKRPHP